MSDVIEMPVMTEAQQQAWMTLLDLHEELPRGWTMVGGQMVHLWCAERDVVMVRPTDDADIVLDVRLEPTMLLIFTAALQRRGFEAETAPTGVQHRWRRGDAVIDVLIPRHLGRVAANRTGAGGGRTIETPGAQKAVDRTETVQVRIDGHTGAIPRPSLLGALVAKGAAFTVPLDPNRERHLGDFALLATLLRPGDVEGHPALDKRELQLVTNALGSARTKPGAWSHVDDGEEGLDRLAGVVEGIRRDREMNGSVPTRPMAHPAWGAARSEARASPAAGRRNRGLEPQRRLDS